MAFPTFRVEHGDEAQTPPSELRFAAAAGAPYDVAAVLRPRPVCGSVRQTAPREELVVGEGNCGGFRRVDLAFEPYVSP
jgi:hypothetical protein